MKPIIFPLKPQMQGPNVAGLHEALTLLGLKIADAEKTAQRYGASTRQSVSKFQSDRQLDATGVVDEATASAMNNVLTELGALDDVPPDTHPTPGTPQPPSYTVIGRVLRADGPPVTDAKVEAFHKNLRSEISLGRGVGTDAKGFYGIRYDPPPGVNAVDLVVRVTILKPDQDIAHFSAFVCDARRLQVVDVIVGGELYRGFSEFERLTSAVQPHLDGASLVALDAEDIELLACKTAQDVLLIAYLVVANRYKERTDIAAARVLRFLPTRIAHQLARVAVAANQGATRCPEGCLGSEHRSCCA